jgi:hypothetical protein
MQVSLIDLAAQRIDAVGDGCIDADEIDANGDRLYFDASCFIRQVAGAGRLRLGSLAPVAGRGVVAGSDAATGALRAPQVTLEALAQRVRVL